jgi:hypothetical protein
VPIGARLADVNNARRRDLLTGVADHVPGLDLVDEGLRNRGEIRGRDCEHPLITSVTLGVLGVVAQQ